MSDSSAVLGFLIDSPMMSWGVSSRFNQRETEAYPSKSALIGMIAAAMGIDKHSAAEPEQIAKLAKLRLTVFRLERRPGSLPRRLSDFHTVGGGYDPKYSSFDRMSVPRKASGGPSANAVITRRSYLTESLFIALWEGQGEILKEASAALLDPKWGVWFGRKTCIPATPLSPVLAATAHEAIAALLQKLGRDPAELETLEGLTESEGPGTWYQADQPVAFGQHHGAVPESYQARPVRRLAPGEMP